MDPSNPAVGVREDGTLVYARDHDAGVQDDSGPPPPSVDFDGYALPQVWDSFDLQLSDTIEPAPQSFLERSKSIAVQVLGAVAGIATVGLALWGLIR